MNFESIIWYLFLIDAVGANLTVWFFPTIIIWYKKNFPRASKYLPLTKGWALVYLILVIWVGCALWRLGILSSPIWI